MSADAEQRAMTLRELNKMLVALSKKHGADVPVRVIVDRPFSDDEGTDIATTRPVIDCVYVERELGPFYALAVGRRVWIGDLRD